jgi:beta-galactosidase
LYYFGGDYQPDQWSAAVRAQDRELMRRAGVNLATVGVFSWSALEPAAGQHDFAWLDEALAELNDAGIGVALATPTASPPPWFTLAHPDAMPVTREGVRLVHGSRDTYCVNAPAYRSACRDIAGQLAQRYARHPAVRMWHVHNEYGTWCFCDWCARAFRVWLEGRYGGLGALNEAWSTAFWGQGYGCWAEILPPRATQYLRNPAQEVDYRRFLSASLLAAFTEQRDVIRAAGPTAPVTTNFVLGDWVPVNHAQWARETDFVAIDHYPDSAGEAMAQSSFAADLARGWSGGEPWLLMEHPPRPDPMMTAIALQHIAKGSQGALFFQWRASRGGAEQWHPALVPHEGDESEQFRQCVALGRELLALPGSTELPAAQIGLWHDEECSWAVQATHGLPVRLDYQQEVLRCHGLLERLGYAADVVTPSVSFRGYRLLLLPFAYLLSDAALSEVEGFVRDGGRVLVGEWSAVVDEHLKVRAGRPLRWSRIDAETLAAACAAAGIAKVAKELPPGARGWRSRGVDWVFEADRVTFIR